MGVESQQKFYRAGTEGGPSFDLKDKSIDEVLLVNDPKLYFPLNHDFPQSTRGQEIKSLENVCLWETDIVNLKKDFILKEKFDGVCQVELKDSTNANCTLTEEKIQEIQRCLKSLKWRKTTVPKCRGGFSLMHVSPLVQAVVVYLTDHFPINAKELNFHAELKAASQWCWSDDYNQLVVKKVPDGDCRLKIAAKETLKTWHKMKEELLNTSGDKINESVDKKLSDLRKAIDVLNEYTGSGASKTSHVNGLYKRKVSEPKGEIKSGQAASKRRKQEGTFHAPGRRSSRLIQTLNAVM